MSALRCPYCHTNGLDVGPVATCAQCQAVAHPECALELARCAACGCEQFGADDGPPTGWKVVPLCGAAEGAAAFVLAEPRLLASGPPAVEHVQLSLDLARREVSQSGWLAGEAVVEVPHPARLGALRLELIGERVRPGLFRIRRRARRLLRLHLLGADAPRTLLGRALGVYAPGTYRVRFRVPLRGVEPTCEAPGAPEHHLLRAELVLDHAHGAMRAPLELRVRQAEAQAPQAVRAT